MGSFNALPLFYPLIHCYKRLRNSKLFRFNGFFKCVQYTVLYLLSRINAALLRKNLLMGLDLAGPDNTVTYGLTSEAFVHYSLFCAMFALGVAFVFFFEERGSTLPAYRITKSVEGPSIYGRDG